jgi:hypothetical protein
MNDILNFVLINKFKLRFTQLNYLA